MEKIIRFAIYSFFVFIIFLLGYSNYNSSISISNLRKSIGDTRKLYEQSVAVNEKNLRELREAKRIIQSNDERLRRYETTISSIIVRLQKSNERFSDLEGRYKILSDREREGKEYNDRLRELLSIGIEQGQDANRVLKEIRERGPISIKE